LDAAPHEMPRLSALSPDHEGDLHPSACPAAEACLNTQALGPPPSPPTAAWRTARIAHMPVM
jgi:hypothetical protein